jgi:ABC-type cobalamin/Fe3+-siderophores transport system ATPase subunit
LLFALILLMASVLQVSNLSLQRDEDDKIFENVSFKLYEGDIVVLSGRSGSGKTTLLKCLAHLNQYEGEVLFHDRFDPQSSSFPAA